MKYKTRCTNRKYSSLYSYGFKTWILTLKEKPRLRVFENRILRRISGPKKDVNGEWRRLHNEELHSLYCSPTTVRVIKSRRLDGQVM